MFKWGQDIGIGFAGTATVIAYVKGKGIVLKRAFCCCCRQ